MYELRQINKSFTGVHALKSVDLNVDRGEIVGLVGENGAGKSTLMKIIYGACQPDNGEIVIDGASVSIQSPREALDKGIGMVFQEQSLIPHLSVMENIFLGKEAEFTRYGAIDWKAMAAAARKQLEKVRLDVAPGVSTSRLTFTQRQLIELAKVLTLEDRVHGNLVILLDEPTSVLPKEEIELLFAVVRELRSRASFIFVSHRVDEVIELTDRIYVLKDGAVVDVVTSTDANVEMIQRKMVGRSIDTEYYREPDQKPFDSGEVVLEARSLALPGHYNDISFELHAGEVLSLVGVEGSGSEAILRSIAGLETPAAGKLAIQGNEFSRLTPRLSVRHGVGYIPRERKVEGIIGAMCIYENITLPQMENHSRRGVFRIDGERELARNWINRLSIKTKNEVTKCADLSGGNQQKVVLAKWRSGAAKIFLMDHPTRGLDIGAKEDVYEMVREITAARCAVILVADTLEEAIGLSHTILAVKDGEIQYRFDCEVGRKPSLYELGHYTT